MSLAERIVLLGYVNVGESHSLVFRGQLVTTETGVGSGNFQNEG